jgi:competence protein ComFB
VGIRDDYNFEYLVNEAERLVVEQLESQLTDQDESKVCMCQDCVLDMAAFALNKIKPVYRVSLMGNLYARSLQGSEYEAEITEIVAQAIRKIAENPSH